MANYANQFPANPQKNDIITFTGATEKSYTLNKAMIVDIVLEGGGGGKGGGAGEASKPDFDYAKGGAGGKGGRITFRRKLEAGVYRVIVGAKGANGTRAAWYPGDSGNYNGGAGKAGGDTILSDALGTIIAKAFAGGGGGGAKLVLVTNQVTSFTDGAAGTNGSTSTTVAGGSNIVKGNQTTAAIGIMTMTVFSANEAPTTPGSITYGTPRAGKALELTITPATDPEAQTLTYTYERQTDSGAWVQVASTPNITATDAVVPSTGTQVRYRAKATDSEGAEGAYITGTYKTIDYNNAPGISGTDGDLGSIGSAAPNWSYTVNDADASDDITVTERLDGVLLRTFDATRGENYALTVPSDAWLRTKNGAHTLTIEASDGKDVTLRTLTFTRRNTKLRAITHQTTSTRATSLALTLAPHPGTWPSDAIVTIKACNDCHAAEPHWETLDNSYINQGVYTFANSQAAEGETGVAVDITVEEGVSGQGVSMGIVVMSVSG